MIRCRVNISGRVVAALGVVVLAVGAAVLGGCQSPGERVFESAEIGGLWTEVPNADLYGALGSLGFRNAPGLETYLMPGPHRHYQKMAVDDQGTYLGIVTNEHGRIVAKAKTWAGPDSPRYLLTTAEHLSEFMDVEKHYPFLSRKATLVPGTHSEVFVTVYPPLVQPLSEADKILPSGTRQSQWCGLAIFLAGWPFAERDRSLLAWVDGQVIAWDALVTTLEQGKLRGMVKLIECRE